MQFFLKKQKIKNKNRISHKLLYDLKEHLPRSLALISPYKETNSRTIIGLI